MSYDLPPVVLPVDNSSLATGMNEAASIVAGGVAKINQALRGLQPPARGANAAMAGMGFAYANPTSLSAQGFQGNLNGLRLMQRDSDRLGVSLDRIGKQFTGGLGIGATVGGFALVERVLDKAINKAKEFQTATISIAATMSSLGTRSDKLTGKTLDSRATFEINMREAENIRRQILSRSARTILTFQEQMGAFESSLNPGTRKGFSPNQTMDLSERAAIVAKTLGLRGEQISNASRLLLGGGVNVARSTIGRALGIQNSDIAGRYGDQLYRFLDDRLKGFTQAQDEFAGSIEGVLSTIESRVDTLLAMSGERFFKNPKVKTTLGRMLQGVEKPEQQGGESDSAYADRLKEWEKDAAELNQTIDSLADLFSKLFDAISQLAKSPEAKVFQQFLMDVAQYADKIVLGAVFMKIAGAIGSATSALRAFGMQMTQIASGNLAGGLLAAAPSGSLIGRVAGSAMHMAGRGGVPGASIATKGGMMAGSVSPIEGGIMMKLASMRAGQSFDTVLSQQELAHLQKAAPNTPLGRLAQNIWGLDSSIGAVNGMAAAKSDTLNTERKQVRQSAAQRLKQNEQARAAQIARIEALRQKELDEAYKQVKTQKQPTFGSNSAAFMNAWDAIFLGKNSASLDKESFKPEALDAYNSKKGEINSRYDAEARLANARAKAKEHGIMLPTLRRISEIDSALLQTELARANDVSQLVRGALGTNYVAPPTVGQRFDGLMAQRRELEAEQADLVKRQRLQRSGISRKSGEALSEFGLRNSQVLGFQQQRLLDIAGELDVNKVNIYDTEGLSGKAALQRQMVTGIPALNGLRERAGASLTNMGMRLQNYGGIALAGGLAAYELNGLGRNNDNATTRGAQFLGSGLIGGVAAGGMLGGVPGAIAGGVVGLLKGTFDIVTASVADLGKQADASAKALEDMRAKLPASTQRYLALRDKVSDARAEATDSRTTTQRQIEEEQVKYYMSPTELLQKVKSVFMPFASREQRWNEEKEVGERNLSARRRVAALETEAAKARIQATEITNERLERSERAAQTISNADAEIKRLNEGVQNLRTQDEMRQQQVRRRKAQIEKGEADRTLMNGVDYFVEQRLRGTRFGGKGVLNSTEQKEYEKLRASLVEEYDQKAARVKERQLAEVDDVADIEKRSGRFQYRAQLAQMTGNGSLASVLTAFAQATEMTKNVDPSKRPAFMREVVTSQARELSRSLRADIMQRDQTLLAMSQFPANARLALRSRELEGRALGLEGRKLGLDAEQLDLGDKKLVLTAKRMALVIPQLDLRAEQLNLDAAKLALDMQASALSSGRNQQAFTNLMNPAQDRFAQFEDATRGFQGMMGLRQAQRGLVAANDAPTMFYGGLGPVSNIAAQLRYRVEARYAQRFNPGEYEAAYGRQIESQLANMGDEQLLAQNRVAAAQIEIAKNELALQSATEALRKAREDAALALQNDALNAQAQLMAQKGQGFAQAELGFARSDAALDAQGLALQQKGQGLSREELAQRKDQYGVKLEQYNLAGPELMQRLLQQLIQLKDQYDTLTQNIQDKSKAGDALKQEAATLNVPVDVSVNGLTQQEIEQQLPSIIRKAIEDFCRMRSRVPGN